jgi:TRAP-type transport system periplasmic protein
MKKYLLGLSVLTMVVVLAVFLLPNMAGAQDKVIKLKYACFFPAAHKGNILTEQWCKEVEKRTKGRVKVSFLGGGTLVPAPQGYEAAVKGIADISNGAPSWTAGRFPLSEVLELPLGYRDAAQASRLANAFYKKFKPKEYDDVKMLYMWNSGPGVFMTTKPISSIEGLKGLKLRAAGNQAKIATAMGVTPVSVPIGDIYEGLQRNVIEGLLFYPESLKSYRFGDLIRGLQDNPGINWAGTGFHVMNKQKWNALPPDIQKIIEEVTEEWAEKHAKLWADTDKEGRDFGVSKGMKIFKMSPEEAAKSVEKVKPLFDDYVKSMKEKGLPGEEALKFCREWLKANK